MFDFRRVAIRLRFRRSVRAASSNALDRLPPDVLQAALANHVKHDATVPLIFAQRTGRQHDGALVVDDGP